MRILRTLSWVATMVACALAYASTGHMLAVASLVTLIAIPVVGWLMNRRVVPKLVISLDCDKAPDDTAAKVRVSVANPTPLPVFGIEAELLVRNLLTDEITMIASSCSVAGGETATMMFTLSCGYAGRVLCRLERVRAFDLLRVLSCDVPCEVESRTTVLPDLHDVFLRDIHSAAPLSDTMVFSPYVKGSDLSEVFSLREYEPGDELRRIHWKLSEKTDQLVVREASLPLDNALLVFWDKSVLQTADESDIPSRADAMAQVVLALMEELTRAGVKFEMASNEVRTGRCPRMFVDGEDDVYETIGHLLSSPVALAGESGLDEYTRLHGALACSRLIYVGAQIPNLAPAQAGGFQTLALVCDELAGVGGSAAGGSAAGGAGSRASGNAGSRASGGVGIEALPNGQAVHFTPGTVREALETVGAM